MSEIAYKLIDNFNTASRDVQKVISTSNLELFMDAWNSLSGYIEELESRITELEAERDDWRKSYINLWRHINNLPQPPEVQE